MKLKAVCCALFALGFNMFLQGGSVLWENGKSDYQIVLPEKYDNPKTRDYLLMAARRLQSAVRQSSGSVELPVVYESKASQEKPGIYIGDTAKIRALGFTPAQFKGFDNLVLIRDGNVYLAGCDRKRDRTLRDNEYFCFILGSVKAVTNFMRNQMDVKFVMPGEIGTEIPRKSRCELPDQLEIMERPPLFMAAGRDYELMYDYANSNFGWGEVFHYRGHSYYPAVPRRFFAQTHPEYFAMIGGKRDPSVGHLCISNPIVQDRIYKELLRRLDAGARVVELGQTDGYTQCECPGCRAFGGVDDPAEKLWILHRSFAERLKKERPGKALLIIAYAPTWNPPKSFDVFPGNVYIELCRYDQKTFDAWKKIKGVLGFTTYLYNWGEYPMPGLTAKRAPAFLAEQALRFRKNNVKGIYRCSFGELFGMEGPGYYVYGRMLENPGLDWRKVEDEYYRAAFGNVAPLMRGFYQKLAERLNGFSLLECVHGGFGNTNFLPSDPRALITYLYSPDVIEVLERKLSGAEFAVRDPKIKKRLELVRKEFNYAKSLAVALHCYNTYRLNMNKTTFTLLGKAVKSHMALLDSYYDANGSMKPFPGWAEIKFLGNMKRSMLATNGRLSAEIGSPFNWNIDLLLEKGVLPGAGVRRVEAEFIHSAPPFTSFDSGIWMNAKWQELTGIQLGEIREHTKFKVLYDKSNLYFAFESDLPDDRKVIPLGKDGRAWLQDCIEIMLDPFGMREKSMHFVYNPVPGSCYEGAIGMITDVLHPMYGQEDIQWNCKWDYRTRRENGKWYSMVSIPFAGLGVEAPGAGTVWTMNVARQAYWNPKMKWSGELSLWSPNLENMSVNTNLNSFGELYFKR